MKKPQRTWHVHAADQRERARCPGEIATEIYRSRRLLLGPAATLRALHSYLARARTKGLPSEFRADIVGFALGVNDSLHVPAGLRDPLPAGRRRLSSSTADDQRGRA